MRQDRGRVVEVDSLADLDRRLAAGARSMSGWRLRSLDLTARVDAIAGCEVAGATFLECTFARGAEAEVEARGGLVLLSPDSMPVDPARDRLYAPEDLYDAPAYRESFDARAYAWSRRMFDRDALLAQLLHDHGIDRALTEWIRDRRLVGVEYWTETLPAWPLLTALSRGRVMEPHLHLVDTITEAANLLDSGT